MSITVDNPAGPPAPQPERRPSAAAPSRPSFFSIFKKGQGAATRLGTALGAGLLVAFVAYFLSRQLPGIGFLTGRGGLIYGIIALFVAASGLFVWWLMNAPNRAQFLIDTDGEMKKVNWASWRELIGSTRVVIFFMLTLALILFLLDTQFHAMFYGLRVWIIQPEWMAAKLTGLAIGVMMAGIGFAVWRGSESRRARMAGIAAGALGGVAIVGWGLSLALGRPA